MPKTQRTQRTQRKGRIVSKQSAPVDRGGADNSRPFLDGHELIRFERTDRIDASARPSDLDAVDAGRGAETEGKGQLALRRVARPGLDDLPEVRAAMDRDLDPRADGVAGRGGPDRLRPAPV